MKVIYIAGPFRGPSSWAVAENVRNAERWALEVAKAGFMPLCPHANTAHFDGLLTTEFWLEGTMELLERCDGAVFIPGWRASKGSRAEYEFCVELGMPFWDLDLSFAHGPEKALAFMLKDFMWVEASK